MVPIFGGHTYIHSKLWVLYTISWCSIVVPGFFVWLSRMLIFCLFCFSGCGSKHTAW